MAPSDIGGSAEERREGGTALVIIGVVLWCFDALVFFFLPAGFRIGHHGSYLAIVIVLALIGLGLISSGSRRRAAA